MLNEPKMTFNLGLPPHMMNTALGAGAGSNDPSTVNVSCMDFPEDETDKFFVGSEDFSVY